MRLSATLIAPLLACSLLACADSSAPTSVVPPDAAVDLSVQGDAGPTCSAPLDVVFVIDISTSMGDVWDALAEGLADIWTATHALSSEARLSLVVFVDDAVAVRACAPYATPADFLADLWALDGNSSPVSHAYNEDSPENTLDALYIAATECTWREDATHIVVHATDDTFREPPAYFSSTGPGTGVPALHTYAETTAALVEREIRVGTFAPTLGRCEDFVDTSFGRGYASPYEGMPSLVDATGGSAWSICDVRSGALDMGDEIVELIETEYCTLY